MGHGTHVPTHGGTLGTHLGSIWTPMNPMTHDPGVLGSPVPMPHHTLHLPLLLSVYVRDSPYSARYDAATVIVSVEDVNDNAPIIGEATCREQSVPENQPFDVFHTIIASDKDTGFNGRLSFAIVGMYLDRMGPCACD